MASINERRLAVIQRVSREFAEKHRDLKPNPEYSTDEDSQYPEGVPFLAGSKLDEELHRMIEKALKSEGLPTTF